MPLERNWTDQGMEIVIGKLLRGGVLLSAFVVLIGACIYLARHGGSPVEYHAFRGEPTKLRDVRGVLHDTLTLRGRGIIQFGLLLLIATPVARVGFSVLGFFEERDYMYVAFTLVVLSVLLYSIFWSR
jgi:uncharacterized membrane protein